jgi:hypothetical protein
MSCHSTMAMQNGLNLNTFILTKMFLYVGANVICEWTLGDLKRVWIHVSFQCVCVNPDVLSSHYFNPPFKSYE